MQNWTRDLRTKLASVLHFLPNKRTTLFLPEDIWKLKSKERTGVSLDDACKLNIKCRINNIFRFFDPHSFFFAEKSKKITRFIWVRFFDNPTFLVSFDEKTLVHVIIVDFITRTKCWHIGRKKRLTLLKRFVDIIQNGQLNVQIKNFETT